MNKDLKRLAIVFVIGLLAGAAVGAATLRVRFQRMGDPAQRRARMLERFTKRLDLKPEQREKISELFDKRRAAMEQVHADAKPKLEAIRKETSEQIRALLDPDQQSKYDAMRAEREKRRKEREARGEEPWPPRR